VAEEIAMFSMEKKIASFGIICIPGFGLQLWLQELLVAM